MKLVKHLPLVVLSLMLIAAAAAMSIGWVLAREEREELVSADDGPLTEFAASFGKELAGLEKNLDRTLLVLGRSLKLEMSDRAMVSLGETYAGVRQISVVKIGRLGKAPVLEESLEVGGRFLLPRLEGRGRIDLERLETPGLVYFWAKGPKGSSYFVTRYSGDAGRVLILGIDKKEVVETMTAWLGEWAGKSTEPMEEWRYRLRSPLGTDLVAQNPGEERGDTIYPVSSRMGSWQLQAWNQRRTVVKYREQVLITAAGIAVGLVLVGVALYFLLRRSVVLAMQRVSFVNQVSHELRTPLTSMMLNLDLTKDSVVGNEVAVKRLGLMGEELGRLQRMLENVLTFSNRKKNQAPQALEEVELAPEIERAIAVMKPAFQKRGIVVKMEMEEGLWGGVERDGFTQVLGNLFSNVVKYGGAKSEVIVKTMTKKECAVLQVIDSGAGVDRKDRDRIFRPFFRLSSRVDEGVSGSGLGLAIARDLAAAMGGELKCLAREDGESGACFELSVPLVRREGEIVPFQSEAS